MSDARDPRVPINSRWSPQAVAAALTTAAATALLAGGLIWLAAASRGLPAMLALSMVLFAPLPALLAVVLGTIGAWQCRRDLTYRGNGLSLAATLVGYLVLLAWYLIAVQVLLGDYHPAADLKVLSAGWLQQKVRVAGFVLLLALGGGLVIAHWCDGVKYLAVGAVVLLLGSTLLADRILLWRYEQQRRVVANRLRTIGMGLQHQMSVQPRMRPPRPVELDDSVDALRRAGVHLQFDPDGWAVAARLTPRTLLPSTWLALGRLPRLRSLSLAGTDAADDELLQVARLRRLAALDLGSTQVTDHGLSALAPLAELVQLRLAATAIGDDGLAQLAPFEQLASLDLDRTRVSDDGLRQLAQLPRLEVLSLRHTAVTDKGTGHLKQLPRLRCLALAGCTVTAQTLEELQPLRPRLEGLDLSGTQVADQGVGPLAGYTQLKLLCLNATGLTDAMLARLAPLEDLAWLEIRSTSVTDNGAARLVATSSLQLLALDGSQVSAAGIHQLEELLRGCAIGHGGPDPALEQKAAQLWALWEWPGEPWPPQ